MKSLPQLLVTIVPPRSLVEQDNRDDGVNDALPVMQNSALIEKPQLVNLDATSVRKFAKRRIEWNRFGDLPHHSVAGCIHEFHASMYP